MVPAVHQGLCRSLFVLVVAQHHVVALGKNLAGDVLWVGAVNLQSHSRCSLTAGTLLELGPVLVCQNGGAFCCAIAHAIVEVDILQQSLNLGIDGSTAYDGLIEVAAECILQALADLLLYLVAYHWHLEQNTDLGILDLRKDGLAHNLLQDKGDANDDLGLDIGKCLEQYGRSWHLGEEVHLHATHKLVEEFECQTIHVCHGEHREHVLASLELVSQLLKAKLHIAVYGAIGNHHTL